MIISIWNWALNKIKLWWNPSSARILVLAQDTLDAAEEQVKQGGNVLVLSLASTEEPGGGFDEGIGSQEEELCWRSDLAGLMHVLKEEEQPKNPALGALSSHLKEALNILLGSGFSYFHQDINQLLVFKRRLVEVELKPNATVQGRVMGIDEDGALLLEMPQEEILKLYTGRILRVIDEESKI